MVFCFVVILLLVSMSVYRWNEKRKTEQKAYLETLDRLGNVQKELQLLRSHEEGLGELIAEKEKEVGNLLQEINSLRKWQDPINTDKELLLKSSPVCQELERVSSVGRYLTEEEWSRIDNFVKETLPDFYQLISSKRYALNVKEFRTCILLRLYVKPGGISHILGVDPSYITKISKHISEVLFNTQWTSKQLTVQLCRFF